MPVTFKNNKWTNGVNVQVQINNQADETLWMGGGSRKISFQDSWTLDLGNSPGLMIRHRRDSNPDNPDGTFTEWKRSLALFVHEVDIE